jgi:hypothetical protein
VEDDMESLRAYIGELVVVGGFPYEILWFELRNREMRCVAYSDELAHEINISVRDVLANLVAETTA